ncbi:MAG: hypothetical protein ACE5G3_03835 [Gammaproteobacteria bacterium]
MLRKLPWQRALQRAPASGAPSHDVGAADMEFTSHRPDGSSVEFRFTWKKRPTDASEADWPVDKMHFTAARASGKRTALTFERKTRPVPAGYNIHPGLGEARMEFVARHPGQRDFRFTWDKEPPPGTRRTREQPADDADTAASTGDRPARKTNGNSAAP